MFPYEDSKTVSVCPYPEKRNHHSFVNISPTLTIDTSMERSSRVLHHGNPIFFFFKKVWNWILTCILTFMLKSLNQHSRRSQHAPIWRHRGCIVVPSRVDIYLVCYLIFYSKMSTADICVQQFFIYGNCVIRHFGVKGTNQLPYLSYKRKRYSSHAL